MLEQGHQQLHWSQNRDAVLKMLKDSCFMLCCLILFVLCCLSVFNLSLKADVAHLNSLACTTFVWKFMYLFSFAFCHLGDLCSSL